VGKLDDQFRVQDLVFGSLVPWDGGLVLVGSPTEIWAHDRRGDAADQTGLSPPSFAGGRVPEACG